MKKLLKIAGYIFGLLIILLAMVAIYGYGYYTISINKHMSLTKGPVKVLNVDGIEFRDLNKNGKLDPYEDKRQTVEERIEDLLSQMNLEEKTGMMFINMAGMGKNGELLGVPNPFDPISFFHLSNAEMILEKNMTHVNLSQADAVDIGIWANNIQKLAEQSRLGIPVTIATDPRHAFSTNPLAGFQTKGFSQWPEALGFAALRDTTRMFQFAEIARGEYRKVGIHLALHPVADLATEPRWPRISGTFGEDADLASQMVHHYINGFQGDSLGNTSVSTMTKHFSGGGPQKEGLDPHFEFGKEQVYPGDNFEYHLLPFYDAIKANTSSMMTYYGIPIDQTGKNVGFAFDKSLVTDRLRNEMGFEGVICTDWSVITDKKFFGMTVFTATAWGVEHLSPKERMQMAIDAGVDQFGGEEIPELLIELVKEGKVTEARIDSSVRRLLKVKFQLGLFDHPFIEDIHRNSSIASEKNIQFGQLTQGEAMVLLENKNDILPLRKGLKLYVENISFDVASKFAEIVTNPEEADFAIIRLETPYQILFPGRTAAFFHHGDLDFKEEEKKKIIDLMRKVPTIVDIYLDRPAVIPEISEMSAALLANFGATDEVLMQVLFGQISPKGKLPVEMPSYMETVKAQFSDLPYDSAKPLYEFGYGLNYGKR